MDESIQEQDTSKRPEESMAVIMEGIVAHAEAGAL